LRSRRLQIFLFQAIQSFDSQRFSASDSHNTTSLWKFEWKIYRKFVYSSANSDQMEDQQDQQDSLIVLNYLKDTFNDLYSYIFYLFNEKWVQIMRPRVEEQFKASSVVAKPVVPILEFPQMFSEFKNDIQRRIIMLPHFDEALTFYTIREWVNATSH
jgi:hypothetical protein